MSNDDVKGCNFSKILLNAQVPRNVPHKKPKQVCQQLAPTSGSTGTGGGFQLVGVGGTGTGTGTGTGLLSSLLGGR
jgi:hypothetical protein